MSRVETPQTRRSREGLRKERLRVNMRSTQTVWYGESDPDKKAYYSEYYKRPDVIARCTAGRIRKDQPRRDRMHKLARKIWCVQRAGGVCQRCGYDWHPAALVFHHRDPEQKAYQINDALGRSYRTLPNETLALEVDKCDLLCANCHAEIEVRYTRTDLAEIGWL